MRLIRVLVVISAVVATVLAGSAAASAGGPDRGWEPPSRQAPPVTIAGKRWSLR